ncbi:hypothetical protein VTJ49DRAFT_7082 [Mycothermus thermophilus]|uniref:Stress-response A/B barrel domain-containing protein n=1 Tax=Humicola insolens TaxID=85995 RepID=A0ABR3VJ52_HUMIN
MSVIHVVLFQFKSDASPEGVKAAKACDRFLALKANCIHPASKMPYILSLRGGRDHSPEGLQNEPISMQNGLTHGFVVEFASVEDRDYYVTTDPAHREFVKSIGELLEKPIVLDFSDGVTLQSRNAILKHFIIQKQPNMPQSVQTPEAPGPEASEKIPPLTNIAPGIFVPLRDVDLANFKPPRDRIERLKSILSIIDYHREGIRENLLYMFEREKRRLVQQAAETEQQLLGPTPPPPKSRPGLSADEVDELIANMEAPAQPGVDYNVRNIALSELTAPPLTAGPPPSSVRDATVRDLLVMVERAMGDLHGSENFLLKKREEYLALLDREIKRLEGVGMRPEERRGSGAQ